MAQELTLFKSNGAMQRSKVFDQIKGEEHALSAGVGPGFARITYKGGKWGVKYQGDVKMFRRYIMQGNQQIDDGPNPKLDIVILKVAENASKYFYAGAYTEGDTHPPDCFSTNGIKPDKAVAHPVNDTCKLCPNNLWASAKPRQDGTPSKGKACTDHKRLVVVPVNDIENKLYGGPMLLLVPPTSLKMLAPYEQKLARAGYRFMEVWTQLSFDEQAAFPLFDFDAIRPLTDQEGELVVKMRNDDLVERILNTDVVAVEGYDQPEYAAPASNPAMPNPPAVNAAPPQPQPMTVEKQAPLPSTPASPPAAPPPNLAVLGELLKQLSPEHLAALGLAAPGQPQSEKKTRKPRTPAPSPRPDDTTHLAEASSPPAANNNGDDANVAEIMSKIDSLIPQSE